MLTVDLAQALRSAGLRWTPAAGDHFVIANRQMDDEVFVISNMTVDVHEFGTETVIGFNGTTEWALDSVPQQDALWLPAEHQLRDLLGGLFRGLRRHPDGAFTVTIETPAGEQTFQHEDAAQAYGRALLAVLREVAPGDPDDRSRTAPQA